LKGRVLEEETGIELITRFDAADSKLEDGNETIMESNVDDILDNNDKTALMKDDKSNRCTRLWSKLKLAANENWKLFVIKPVLILYMLQYSIGSTVNDQLWLEKTCSVTLGYNDTVCKDLTNATWSDIQDDVQKEVTELKIVDTYIGGVPPIIISLYLGPLADRGRKRLMYLPFIGHFLSGIVPILVANLKSAPPQLLWLTNIYIITGGYTVLQIAMYGYIGDVTNTKNRTAIMTLLSGLGIVMWPVAKAVGGQLYKAGGYNAVYGTAMSCTFLGVAYVYFVPETVTKRVHIKNSDKDDILLDADFKSKSFFAKLKHLFYVGNRTVLEAWRCFIRKRENGTRKFILAILGLGIFRSLTHGSGSGLLFTEKMFGWGVVEYANYSSFELCTEIFRTLVTTTVLCYFLGVHDFMLVITGSLADIAGSATEGFATKGWMMYYSRALTIMGPSDSTPLRSFLSKCVDIDEYGKVFTLSAVIKSVAELMTSALTQQIYAWTITFFPGAMYLYAATTEAVATILLAILYYFVARHERRHGPIGRNQDNAKKAVVERV